MKVGLTLDQCNNFKSILNQKDKEIQKLYDYIEGMNSYFKKAEEIGQHIHNMILPLIKPIQPMTLQNYVGLSSLKEHNKKYLRSLFKKYTDYCKKDLNISDFKTIDGCPLDLNLDIYNPDNVIRFMKDKCNFKRTNVKKIRDIFLRAMRKITRNPSLDYSVPLGNIQNPNIKHFMNHEELKQFMIYLKGKGNLQLFILFELLYKFGVRVGALSKLKVNDLSDEGL
jgi:integrase